MRIAVFFDGTWNEPHTNTNVVQLSRRVEPTDAEGVPQEVVYRGGVGTKVGQRLRGGLFGYGLNERIEEAYTQIARRYRGADDQLYLFGFSRGAFSARSLAGMIARCGIIGEEHLSAHEVFARYRNREGSPGLNEMLTGKDAPRTAEDRTVLEHSTLARIRFIGVFDTVGRLGIPGGLFRPLTRERYKFHDTKLSGLVDDARHALAIDEQRPHFPATLWDGVPTPIPGHATVCIQRWFAGSHGNVGGGGTDRPEVDNPLSAVAREWLCDEARAAGLAIRPDPIPETAWSGPIRDSYAEFGGGLFYKAAVWRRRNLREIGATAAGEEIGGSVVRRADGDRRYRPGNRGYADALRVARERSPVA